MDEVADVEALVELLRELGWKPSVGFPIELQAHYDQGVRDGLLSKELPRIYSKVYLNGWTDGRIGRAAIKVMKLN